MSTSLKRKVAILGGGPGGLTLARLLQRHGGFDVTVYERDASRDARAQGGTLDLHADSGQRAIHAMGLEREFAALSRPEGQATRIFNKQGHLLLDEVPAEGEDFRPEIDRGVLRDLLLDSLLPGTLLWNAQVLDLASLSNGRWCVSTRDGRQDIYDLVVGCDGASSRARSSLSDAVPIYSGITYVESGVPSADITTSAVASLVGKGSMFALGDARALLAQRNGGGYVRIYVAFAVEEVWSETCGIDFGTPLSAREALLEMFADWATELRQLLEATQDRFVARPLYRLPFEHRWQTRPSLTLLGDAAHLMTPFAGQGANLAMLDAVDLAECLADSTFSSMTDALSAFESRMQERSSQAAIETQRNQDLCFGPDAAAQLARLMQAYQQEG